MTAKLKTSWIIPFYKFQQRTVSSTKIVQPGYLRLTSDATTSNSFWIYHQLQNSNGRETLCTKDWSWKKKNEKLIPHLDGKDGVPASVLTLIRSNSKRDCNKQKRICRQHNLKYSNKGDKCRSFLGISCCEVWNRMSFVLGKYGTAMYRTANVWDSNVN